MPTCTRHRPTRTVAPDDVPPPVAWVDATPFRVLLRRLIEDTGFGAPVVAAALGIPVRMALTLAGGARPVRRIRWVDALALLRYESWQLVEASRRAVGVSEARALLAGACPDLEAPQLARLLRIAPATAEALLDGRCDSCDQLTVWRIAALAEGWISAAAGVSPGVAAAVAGA